VFALGTTAVLSWDILGILGTF